MSLESRIGTDYAGPFEDDAFSDVPSLSSKQQEALDNGAALSVRCAEDELDYLSLEDGHAGAMRVCSTPECFFAGRVATGGILETLAGYCCGLSSSARSTFEDAYNN